MAKRPSFFQKLKDTALSVVGIEPKHIRTHRLSEAKEQNKEMVAYYEQRWTAAAEAAAAPPVAKRNILLDALSNPRDADLDLANSAQTIGDYDDVAMRAAMASDKDHIDPSARDPAYVAVINDLIRVYGFEPAAEHIVNIAKKWRVDNGLTAPDYKPRDPVEAPVLATAPDLAVPQHVRPDVSGMAALSGDSGVLETWVDHIKPAQDKPAQDALTDVMDHGPRPKLK
jgi:hypothetical protein